MSVLNNILGLKPAGHAEQRFAAGRTGALGMVGEELFLKLLRVERKRTERSGRRFLLMLLDTGNLLNKRKGDLEWRMCTAIAQSSRDTDIRGWYRTSSIVGVIFTEIGPADDKSVVQCLSGKLVSALYERLSIAEMNEVKLSFHIFPEDWSESGPDSPTTSRLEILLGNKNTRGKVAQILKRSMDVGGSLLALLLFLPVMLVIAAAVKVTSRGPVLFRQKRVGQYGKAFTFLKFRSMYVNSDHKVHEEYVRRFIVGQAGAAGENGTQQMYKMTGDKRVTPVGRFLRSTSLDELPQFFNVLMGQMSLVGPRPPIGYEVQRYDLWHKQRLMAVKPGITGLWQVEGRSRVKFDDMVRLDIRYARSWSIWLDIKILLQTPGAMLSGNGAC